MLVMDLKTYIETFGFTQAQVAEGVEVGVSAINNYLTGLRCPKGPILLRLEDFTGKKVTAREMISYYEQKQAERRVKGEKTESPLFRQKHTGT